MTAPSERIQRLTNSRSLHELIKQAGAEHDPLCREMLAWTQSPLGQGRHAAKFSAMLNQILQSRILENDLNPAPTQVPELPTENSIVLGHSHGKEVRVSLEDLSRGLIELGPMGAGKTTHIVWLALQLIERGVRVFFMDHKNESRRLIKKLPGKILILRLPDLWFNMLEPVGDDHSAYYAAFAQELGAAFQLHAGTVMKIGETLRQLERGAEAGTAHPSLQDLWRTLEFRAKGTKDNTYKTAATALRSLEPLFGRAARLRGNAQAPDQYAAVALECMGLPPRIVRFVAGLFLNRLQHESRSKGHGQMGLERIYLSDEGSFEFSAQFADTGSSVYLSPQRKLFTQARSSRTCVAVGFQTLSQADPVVKSNAGTFICHRAEGAREQREAAQLLGLPPESAPQLGKLAPGHGYLRAPGLREALPFTFPHLDLGDYVGDNTVHGAMTPQIEDLFAGAEFAPVESEGSALSYRQILGEEEPSQQNQPEESDPHASAKSPTEEPKRPLEGWLEFLEKLGQLEPCAVTALYKALGSSAGRGNRLQEELLSHGLVCAESQKPPSQQGGRPRKLLSLTPKGHEFVSTFGAAEPSAPEQ